MTPSTPQYNNARRGFLKKLGFGFLTTPSFDFGLFAQWLKDRLFGSSDDEACWFTTGFKVMEVSANSAVVWTRLCGQEVRNAIRHERRQEVFRHPLNFDEEQPLEKMDGGVKGRSGFVRMKLTSPAYEQQSPWVEVAGSRDFTTSFRFENLSENTQYEIRVEGRVSHQSESRVVSGRFKTAPSEDAAHPVNLVTSTCQYFWSYDDEQRGFRTYDSMRRLDPDFYIHTGDYVYYDKPGPMATTVAKARHKWHAMDSWPSIRELYEHVPVYMIKDDHDLLKNDVYPGIVPFGQLSYKEGLDIWYENVPLPQMPYRTVRWGKDLQVWMVEGREFRSPNDLEDSTEKTIWGEAQKEWFMKTLENSDASFKLLFTATPVVGPDRPQKKDNHANQVFQTEGNWLRQYLSKQKGVYVVNGDRHWQYVSRDSETGLMEFGSGPVSDYHAQGWNPSDVEPEHRFLRVKGGFLNIRVYRKGSKPYIQFIHRDVDGIEVHREEFAA